MVSDEIKQDFIETLRQNLFLYRKTETLSILPQQVLSTTWEYGSMIMVNEGSLTLEKGFKTKEFFEGDTFTIKPGQDFIMTAGGTGVSITIGKKFHDD